MTRGFTGGFKEIAIFSLNDLGFLLETEIAVACIMVSKKVVRVDSILKIINGKGANFLGVIMVLNVIVVAFLGCIVPDQSH